MTCPDCAGVLVDVSLSGLDKSFRCFSCGGILLIAKTINGLPSEDLSEHWQKMEVGAERLGAGNNHCPHDDSILEEAPGDLVPTELKVRQCPTCHWWWFPGDSLFKFKPFQEQRLKETEKKRAVFPMIMAAMVPLLSLVLLITGAVVGLKLVGSEQKVAVGAAGKLKGAYGVVLNDGKLLITINYTGELKKDGVMVYSNNKAQWIIVNATQVQTGEYQVVWDQVGENYGSGLKLKVDGAETTVTIGR